MRARAVIAVCVIFAGLGGFLFGRESAGSSGATAQEGFHAGYLAGREAVFCCYDGGWGYDEPYLVTLRRGGPGITYRIARRWPVLAGYEYRACGRTVCAGAGE